MIQDVGVYVTIQRILWLNARSDYEPLFSILEGVHPNDDDIEEDIGQVSVGVEILLPVSHNVLTISEEHVK